MKRRLLCLVIGLTLLLGTLAAKSSDWPGTPGTVGYRMPWNRVTRDTVVDLFPGDLVDRFEFRGRLVDDKGRPLAGLLVYAYHADRAGLYGSKAYPAIPTLAGCVSTGPGGGFIVRTCAPGQYEGLPHIHFEASIAGRGRCTWFVNLRADSATRFLPNTNNLKPASYAEEYDEKFALVHLDADGVYRTRWRTFHLQHWYVQDGLDSLHEATARRYERSPWIGPQRPAR